MTALRARVRAGGRLGLGAGLGAGGGDWTRAGAAARLGGRRSALRSASSENPHPEQALAEIWRSIGPTSGFEAAFVLLFASSHHDFHAVAEAARRLPGAPPIFGCTTAGEIGPQGYSEGGIVAVAFDARRFRLAASRLIPLLDFTLREGEALLRRELAPYAAPPPSGGRRRFGLCLVDGLSTQVEAFVSVAGAALGTTPLYGGAAADGMSFGRTWLLAGGRVHAEAGLICVVETDLDVEGIQFDHLEPTDVKFVVTEADPERRIVHELNAVPAAEEYARVVGVAPQDLSPFVFAAHPLVVRVGGAHHVRAVQRVLEGRHLKFYCAIDEGLVLTMAHGLPMAEQLERRLSAIDERRRRGVLAFDCVLRRIEAEQTQQSGRISDVLRRFGVVGFNTYGEQLGSVHANQTFTAISFSEPEPRFGRLEGGRKEAAERPDEARHDF
ncbi:FIST N-terminal domain-containing protein [Neomegalonema sp.]|uniref:FIST N-terminal domain-containing protein n=1 Tax=Neomegalonema sp. TaxID=2039713 RepID=UPI0026381166|nr:FIST N-terminal domain-containing protein [Neomegalonema sp.]MDD2868076.1 FIST N-terminal domain-containing protein [Neomegalonema sp.]